MKNQVIFDTELIKRYDRPGPRYTSYPPATQFSDQISSKDYRTWAGHSNEEPIPRPLSLYFHIPFCNTICYYCACNKVITKNRQKAIDYLEDLFTEIEIQSELYDHDRTVQQLHWGGGTPTFLEDDQIRALMQQIGRYFHLYNNDSGEYSIEVDPRTANVNTISVLRDVGFNRLSLGVQDFDEQVQKAVNRIQSIELTQSIISAARRADYKSINIDLIYGLPFQSVSSFSRTLETLLELNPDRIALYNYAHLPTRFPPQRRINPEDLPRPEDKLDIFQYSIERLTKAGYIYIGMDHFAKPLDELSVAQRKGNLHRNFQGYSAYAECDSVAMGVSAISNIGNHYCQNTTDLKTYHEVLQQRELPIYRGCYTDQEDVLRREIIQQLVCHFNLDITDIEERWDLNFNHFFSTELDILNAMAKDKLVSLSETNIKVLDAGRLLVRNICMVFDRYIDTPDSRGTFSRSI
ncbi:MAG: oxygen-independent coproporphyrinogen III oxidase [Gammaproteobacteria bacterium]|nr:oxygen-independent coproporphyrinogen III oxidase [Gammaproteobacteria bacterium]